VLAGVLPGDYDIVPEGVDPALFGPPADGPGIVVVARERDRTGLRFILRALIGTDPAQTGRISVIAPPEAPQRTRTAVPKALRDRVDVYPDVGAAARGDVLRRGRIVLVPTPDEAQGPVLREAMAAGMCVIAARCPDSDEMLGADGGMTLPPFTAETWADAIAACLSNPARVTMFGNAAHARAGARTWDDVAADLEVLYRGAAARPESSAGTQAPVFADLRVRTGTGLGPREIVQAAMERDIRIVAVAAPGGIEPALQVLQAAPDRLHVIVGQEIDTREGAIIGLFLTASIPDGLALADALGRVRDQGGVTVIPHPDTGVAPPAEALRQVTALIDCHEALTPARPASQATEAALLLQRAGLVVTAGRGAATAAELGTAGMLMRPFAGPGEFLEALADARPVRRRRGLRGRSARSSRRASQPRA
jgi:hypothetical protein